MASEFVKSAIVSMDWVKKGFYKKAGTFYFASKEYENANGEVVTVFFTPREAFFWSDDNCATVAGLWRINDLVPWAQDGNVDGSFPNSWEEFVPIFESDGSVRMDILERFGIADNLQDITNRLEDISKFGELRDAPVTG